MVLGGLATAWILYSAQHRGWVTSLQVRGIGLPFAPIALVVAAGFMMSGFVRALAAGAVSPGDPLDPATINKIGQKEGAVRMPDTCPHCGIRLPAIRDAFCPDCRLPLEDVAAPEPQTSENAPAAASGTADGTSTPRKSSFAWLLYAAMILVGVFLPDRRYAGLFGTPVGAVKTILIVAGLGLMLHQQFARKKLSIAFGKGVLIVGGLLLLLTVVYPWSSYSYESNRQRRADGAMLVTTTFTEDFVPFWRSGAKIIWPKALYPPAGVVGCTALLWLAGYLASIRSARASRTEPADGLSESSRAARR
jgi:hypothetical protein